jgi:hypothetical protein
MGVVVKRMDLTITGGADLNRGTGAKPLRLSFDEESGGGR